MKEEEIKRIESESDFEMDNWENAVISGFLQYAENMHISDYVDKMDSKERLKFAKILEENADEIYQQNKHNLFNFVRELMGEKITIRESISTERID